MTDNGITDISGVPVMDVIAVAWRYAVMLVRLRQTCGLQVSSVGHYARADPGLIAAFTSKA